MDGELSAKTRQKKQKQPKGYVGIFEQIAEIENGAHEAFYLLSEGNATAFEALQRMEVFTFFRYLESKKKQYKTTAKKPKQ